MDQVGKLFEGEGLAPRLKAVSAKASMNNSDADAIASFMRNRTMARNAKVQRVARNRVAKLRFQCRRKCDIAGVPTSHREGTEAGVQRPQRSASEGAMIDSNAEADGRMIASEENAESVEVGEPMDLTSDDDSGDADEVMIGSDVDGEMEVDEETPDSEGDPMQLDEDGRQLAIMLACRRFSAKKGPQREGGKVLNGRISREIAAIPPQQAVSSAVAVLASPSQQPVPVSVSVVASAGSVQPPVAHGPIPANTPADLREARLGKKPEGRAAQDEAAAPSRRQPTSSSEGAVAEDEQKSDTTGPTMTPTSTPPSSTPSSLSASPLPRDPAPTRELSPKPATNTSAPQNRKRRCNNSRPASAPEPTKRSPSPTQASKRIQQRCTDDDAEVIPLNDVAGQAPSVEELQQQMLTAQMDTCPDLDTDLDWSSEEGEGKKAGKGKKGGKGKGNGKKGK